MQEQNFNDNSHTWPRQRAIPLPGLSESSNGGVVDSNNRPSDGLLDAKSLFANLFLPNTSNHDEDDNTHHNTNNHDAMNHRSNSAAPQGTVNPNNNNNSNSNNSSRPISAPPRDLGVFGPESSANSNSNTTHHHQHNLNHNAHTYNGAPSSTSTNTNADYASYGLHQRRSNSTSAVSNNYSNNGGEPTNNFDALLLQHGNALNHHHNHSNNSNNNERMLSPGKSISTPPGMEHAIFSNSNSNHTNSNVNSNYDPAQLGLRRPASTGLINHHNVHHNTNPNNTTNTNNNSQQSAYSSGMHQYVPARASSAAPDVHRGSGGTQTLMDFIIREQDPYDHQYQHNQRKNSPSPHVNTNSNTSNNNGNGGYSDPQQQQQSSSAQYQQHPAVSYAMPPPPPPPHHPHHQIQYMNMPPVPPHHAHPAAAAAYGTVQTVYYQAPPPVNVEPGQGPPPQTVYAAAPYYAVQYHAPPHTHGHAHGHPSHQVRGVNVGVGGIGASTPALPYWTDAGPPGGGNLVAAQSQQQPPQASMMQQQQMQNHRHSSGTNNHNSNHHHKSNSHSNNKSSKSDRRRNNKRGGGDHGSGLHKHNHNSNNNGGSLSQGDLLLEEFRAAKNRNWTIHQIKGHVVEFCKDQNGSRFIQQRLEVADSVEKNMVVRELLPAIRELRNDVFGNYVIQKLLEFGGDDIKEDLAGTLYGEMLSLSLQMYGCRVVQKALETLDDEAMSRLVQEFRGNVVTCIHDQNGNHVIQKCVEVLSNKAKRGNATAASEMEFIINDVLDDTASLSCHPYGCRVLQRILEHCLLPQQFRALDEILECHGDLLDDQYGNYVIQHVLQFGRDSDRESILNLVVQGGLLTLSRQKFASNVVEKLLKYGSPIQRNKIVIEMLKPSGEGTSEVDGSTTSVVLLMVRDAYANYVVQTILDVLSEGEEKVKLLKELNDHADQLRNYTFAKHIVTKLGAA